MLYFKKGKKTATGKEMDMLLAVHRHGSQNRAAVSMGVSVPVLNRRIKGLEEKLGTKLVDAGPFATRLTPEGRRLLERYRRLSSRLEEAGGLTIGATPILEGRLRELVPRTAVLSISNDERNVREFKGGALSLILIDDPEYLMDMSGTEFSELVGGITEVGQDTLLHFDRGPEYIRYGYGAQRLGFRYLESQGIRYEIKDRTLHVGTLFGSGLSFFINKSLFSDHERRGLIPEGGLDGPPPGEVLTHSLNAVTLRGLEGQLPQEIEVLLAEVARTLF